MSNAHWSYNDLYRKFRLEKLTEIPNYPHFALMIVEQRTYSEVGYDPGEPSTTGYYDKITYYAFPILEKNIWEDLINDIHIEQHKQRSFYGSPHPELIFFKSGGRGEIDIKINVNVKGIE